MKRHVGLWFVLFSGLLPNCVGETEGTGSNTNWYALCDSPKDCADSLACLCGVCTQTCDETCGREGDVCSSPGSSSHAALCPNDPSAVAPSEVGAFCLPGCGDEDDCQKGQLCLAGACVAAGFADPGCPPDAELIVESDVQLKARQGMVFSDAFYLPVEYVEQPTDWIEPEPFALVHARVSAQGVPVEGCGVRFWTGSADGWLYADAPTTNAAGEVDAVWVAGRGETQTAIASLVTSSGLAVKTDISSQALAHDQPPLSEDEAARVATVTPTTLRLSYELATETDAIHTTITPRSFPHRSFYGVLSLDGMFTGLQNTSDVDAESGEVAAADRILLFSVWNTLDVNAQLIFQADDVVCAPHTQDEGGIRCTLDDAWQTSDVTFAFNLDIRVLAEGEIGSDYESLGYSSEPCPSAAGCKDFALSFALEGVAPRVLAVLRHPEGTPVAGFMSFVQPYLALANETSCLLTPRHDALFSATVKSGGEFVKVTRAVADPSISTWSNAVCANYGADAVDGQFWLASGGPQALGPPLLPGRGIRLIDLGAN